MKIIDMEIETHGKVFITFHRINWENLAATEKTVPRIIGILKEFIVIIIKVITINVNPIVSKVMMSEHLKNG